MSRQRLTAAIAVSLAVGAATSTAPAVAGPVTEAAVPDSTAQADSSVVAAEPGSEILSAGTTGFLSTDADADVRWTRYADGTSTVLDNEPGRYTQTEWYGSVSDIVAVPRRNASNGAHTAVELVDMSSGAAPVQIDLESLGRGYQYVGAVGSTVVATSTVTAGAQQAHLVTKAGGSLSDRPVTGLPADSASISTSAAAEGTVLLSYRTGSTWYLAVVDLATAAVTETRAVGARPDRATALSSTHIAWFESTDAWDTVVLNVAERGGGAPRRVTVTNMSDPALALVGDWVTYADKTRLTQGDPASALALTAMPVSGGPARRLLEHVSSLTVAADGGVLAMGGTLDGGEGVYRISSAADGAPVARLVASTGEPTRLTLLGHSVPAVVDLDQNRGRVPLAWRLSRLNVDMKVTLRHVRTGRTSVSYLAPSNGDSPGPEQAGFTWMGSLDDHGRLMDAFNGDYTWQIDATPLNGIGPALSASGTFKTVRKAAPHDYTDNGSPDLLARDSSGRLWLEDTDSRADDLSYLGGERRKLVGSGWQIYDQITSTGNTAGATAGDLVARDKAGVLWLYLGKGDGTFATRSKIGGGWQTYNKITAGSDLTGDGRPDLLATDRTGSLWLYKSTGNWRTPFQPRVKTGWGWNIYNKITAVGNVAGTPAGDLLARDAAGVLWLYQGRGDGTFTTRVKIGGGWNAYTHIVGIGDGNRDGHPDLYTAGPDSGTYFYQGTGSAAAPFRTRSTTSAISGTVSSYNHLA